MKRFVLSFLLFVACLCGAVAQNDAMFVYRNDGQINAFLKADVDSMTCSHIGLDSLYHAEYVVQEVWTPDSIYRIPIEAIDSVCFVTHPCPDDNHYHAIDLGLPSGTKWCCCNVGASSPEEYGGRYAWGETKEKSVYTKNNYAFYYGKIGEDDEYINIGSDISGTEYDVAHVRMGGSWRMPTIEQWLELGRNCKWQWTELNGVKGQLVTGPNGGQIFLPATGFNTLFWSSTLDFYSSRDAFNVYFDSVQRYWSYTARYHGYAVRAVCK